MRAFDFAKAVVLLGAAACTGAEFSANAPDASTQAGAGGSGATGVTSMTSSGSAGASVGSGGSSGSAGAGGTASGAGGTSDAGSDGKGGGGAAGSAGSGGGPRNSGDCQTAADCGGDPCVEVFPGGYRVCAVKIPEAVACSNPPGQCCKTSDCADSGRMAKCITGPVEPFCGGPAIVPTNVCASDGCASAADCPGTNAICAPAGTLGRKVARCMTGGCRLDRDCTAEPGGICSPVVNACCNQIVGLFCIYQGGCRSNQDCAQGEHCQTDDTHAFCAPGAQPCPR